MLRNLLFSIPVKSLVSQGLASQQTRNTFILSRKYPPGLYKKGKAPKKMKSKHFVYDLVENTTIRPHVEIPIILTQYVAGLGDKGDMVHMKPNQAYLDFLLPGLALYASPENVIKYKRDSSKATEVVETSRFSSLFAERTMGCLSRLTLNISMNVSVPWVLEPWHVRTSFRKAGFVVPEHAIQMPPGEIRGPDLSLDHHEFLVTVTINNCEKVNVRCRIHHWGNEGERLPRVDFPWKIPRAPLFAEQAETLAKMPLYPLDKEDNSQESSQTVSE